MNKSKTKTKTVLLTGANQASWLTIAKGPSANEYIRKDYPISRGHYLFSPKRRSILERRSKDEITN